MDRDINGSRLQRDNLMVVLVSVIGTAALGLVGWAFNLTTQITALQVQMTAAKEEIGALRSASADHDNHITINTQRLNELERERK